VESAFRLEDLVVRYDTFTAVDHLTLSAERGDVLALLGPNGAGKTSTVEVLEGYRRPTSGSASVFGMDPMAQRRSLSLQMGIMLQQGGVYPVMTPRQALNLFAAYYPNPLSPDDLIDRLGLGEIASTPWRRLSGGEQQRVSFALALVGHPSILFLDEPTAGVDLHGRHAIRELIQELSRDGVTIMLTTHELAEAEAVATNVAILHNGTLAATGSIEELTGDGIRFSATPGLDLADLSARIGSQVEELSAGNYAIRAATGPEVVGLLGSWLAERGASLGDLRSGASLEDTYVAIVGDLAHEPPSEPAPQRRRRGRR
jgi:ABC-2 type transport system ATP-binding protein